MSPAEIKSLLGELAVMAHEVNRTELEILHKAQKRLLKLTYEPYSEAEICQLHNVIGRA